MISAVDNNKNQYYERVQAVDFQAQRGYPPEFYQEMAKKTNVQENNFQQQTQNTRGVEKNFGSLLAYGRSNASKANPFASEDTKGFNLNHPDVRDEDRAKVMDFLA